LECYKN